MSRAFFLSGLLVLLDLPLAAAQDPHFGFALGLGVPVGRFASSDSLWAVEGTTVPFVRHDTYDLGLSGTVWCSFPVDPQLAIRAQLSAMSTSGRGTNPNNPTVNIRHQVFSLGADAQVFLQDAYRHKGPYFIAGLCADFERFERSRYSLNTDPPPSDLYTESKSRMGGNFGAGYSFGYNLGWRFTTEALFHKTLTGNNTNYGDPINTDYVKVQFGMVF